MAPFPTVASMNVKNDGKHVVLEDLDMRTNVEGVFACGDIVEYPGKTRQIQPAAGEGFSAAEAAYKFMRQS